MRSKPRKLSPTEISAFEATRDIGAEILQSIKDMKGGKPMKITRESCSYKLGQPPMTERMAPHNLATWTTVHHVLQLTESIRFDSLVVAARNHVSGDPKKPGARHFIDYCIRNGWLERA